MNDEESRRRMGRKGQLMIREQYTWSSVAKRVLSFYDSVRVN